MRIKALVVAIALTVGSFFGMLALSGETQAAGTCPAGSAQTSYTSSLAECNLPAQQAGEKTLTDRIVTIINVVVSVLGLVTVAVIVLGGITYLTSQGDAVKATKAKNTILYGIVGLIVALLAFAIVNFVSKSVFGSTETGRNSSESSTSIC